MKMKQQQQSIADYLSDWYVLQIAYTHLKNHVRVDVSEGKHLAWCGYDCTLCCRSLKSNLPCFGGRISYVSYSALYRHAWRKRKVAGNTLCCYLSLYLNFHFSSKNCNAEFALWKVLSTVQQLKQRKERSWEQVSECVFKYEISSL